MTSPLIAEPFNYGASNGPTPIRYRADALADRAERDAHLHEPGIRACLGGLLHAVVHLILRR